MRAEERFRSQLREDLLERPAPALGTLAADAYSAGRRMRRRRTILRAAGGTAAVVAVVVGSATVAGVFGAGPPVSAGGGPETISSTLPVTIPPTWTVPPARSVKDPARITSRAIIAEMRQIVPGGTSSSKYSGTIANEDMFTVDGDMTVPTGNGPAEIDVMIDLIDMSAMETVAKNCDAAAFCAAKAFPDGTYVIVKHNFEPTRAGKATAYVQVTRKGGVNVQVTVHDQAKWTDDQLFAVASSGAWATLKMDKSFVDHAEATITGTFNVSPTRPDSR